MKPGMAQKLDRLSRQALPMTTVFIAAFLAAVPTGLPDYGRVVPGLSLMAVFYWSVFRPDLVLPSLIFAIGLVQDALTGTPFGLTALSLLIVHGLAVSQRKSFLGKPAWIAWLGLLLTAAIVGMVQYVLVVLLSGRGLPIHPVVFQILLTAALFPAFLAAFAGLHRHLLKEV